uniref:Protein kinase domain-containing protein n=1 Tax=Lactuca sativa TaxID=4236 RepID=A0A9R1UK50_LACSA|nr:hypothetical protein LSAT_V11C900499520 [Lactuca sativa]
MDYTMLYTPAIDIWSIVCIFDGMLTGKPLFPRRNGVHQLNIFTNLIGSPSVVTFLKKICYHLLQIRNEKAISYLNGIPNKTKVPFSHKLPNADP